MNGTRLEKNMTQKVFVGGLSWDTNTDGLRKAFEGIGPVSDAIVMTDRETGRSRGFGFVTFEASDDARRAISELNGTMFDGRTLRVDQANERPRRY